MREWVLVYVLVTGGALLNAADEDGSELVAMEREMAELVNAERRKENLAPLELTTELCAVARAHSAEMARLGYLDHRSPNTGLPKDRLAAAGIGTTECGENVALNSSVSRAMTGLMSSPGHRANILSPKFTHIGVGIVCAPGKGFYFTQLFAKPVKKVNLAAVPTTLLGRINEEREKRGAGPLRLDAALSRIAQKASDYAEEKNVLPNDELARLMRQTERTARATASVALLSDGIDQALEVDQVLSSRFDKIGIGVALNRSKQGLGLLWLTIVLTK